MRVQIKNLGILKQAELSLGDFTIICGSNNTGKTYATYALFGFLSFWHDAYNIPIPTQDIETLLTDGVVQLSLSEYAHRAPEIIAESCVVYTKQLSTVFASGKEKFQETEFQITVEQQPLNLTQTYEQRIGSANAERFAIIKSAKSDQLVVSLLGEREPVRIPREIIAQFISDALKTVLFSQIVPRPFIASAERTGAAIFRKELNFTRNRVLEEMSQTEKSINPIELLLKSYQDYALPVKANVEFTRDLESIAQQSSFIREEQPTLLSDFADIIGGEYTVTRQDELYYVPRGKRVKLTMDESSSGVRSLLDIGFYLKHVAQRGDLLMIDEPELNLHPENQRRLARLLASLVNLGVKVFITTHSDYLIKELNTLIMLNHDKPHLRQIAEVEGYRSGELLRAEQLRVFVAEKASILLDGNTRKSQQHTLTPAGIDPELGIEVGSFDKTIDEMNRIQEAIVWGAA
ncbi:MAG: AAA family ATPase [Anaerolineales bacterium]|nr:AAA family ATPase [Anaerolineales bacterium]